MRSCIYRFSVIASLSIGLALGVSFPVLAQSSADLGSDPVAWQKELDRATGLVEGDTSAGLKIYANASSEPKQRHKKQ